MSAQDPAGPEEASDADRTETIEGTRSAIAQMLRQLDIECLVIVDDDIENDASDDSLKSVLANIPQLRDELKRIAASDDEYGFLGADGELLDDDELRGELEAAWNRLRPDELSLLQAQKPHERERLSPLTDVKNLLPTFVDFKPLSVAEWLATNEALLAPGHPPTLVFFDRNLTKARLGKKGGDSLAKKVALASDPAVFSGILTQDAPDPETEVTITEELRTKHKVLVPALGKHRTSDPQDFAAGLQLFLHIRSLDVIKSHALNALKAAFPEVRARVESVGYSAMLASAKSAVDEGLFEGDGLLRIARNELRRRTTEHLHTGLPAKEQQAIRDATLGSITGALPRSPQSDHLIRDERFDSASYLSEFHVPTDIGDIFELTSREGEKDYYLLLAQPCDLMVRRDGRRTDSGRPFVLAKLEEQPRGSTTNENRRVEIGAILDDDRIWCAKIKSTIYLSPQLLDACVLSPDGRARLRPVSSIAPHPSAGWEKMHTKIDAWCKARLAEARRTTDLLPTESPFEGRDAVIAALRERAFGQMFVDGRISLTVSEHGQAVVAGIRRVASLTGDRARALLVQLSQDASRPDVSSELLWTDETANAN